MNIKRFIGIMRTPPNGRRLSCLWMTLIVGLFSLSVNAANETKLTDYKYVTSFSTKNCSGTNVRVNLSGRNLWNINDARVWFELVNGTVTMERPYVEFKYAHFYDQSSGNDDNTVVHRLAVKYVGDNAWYDLAHTSGAWSDNNLKRYSVNKGYTVIMRHKDSTHPNDKKSHLGRWRYYPIDMGRRIEKIRLVVHWDRYENEDGNYLTGVENKEYDQRFIYEVDIKHDISPDIPMGSVTAAAGGKIKFNVSNVKNKGYSTGTVSYTAGANVQLSNTETAWNYTYRITPKTVSGAGSQDLKASFSNGTGGASGEISNVNFRNEHTVEVQALPSRSFKTMTNAYWANAEFTVSQNGTFTKTFTIPAFRYPKNLTATPKMWEKTVTLNWEHQNSSNHNDDRYYVYKRLKSEAQSANKQVASLGANVTEWTDKDVEKYDTEYVYTVVFWPGSFGTLNTPDYNLSESVTTSVPIDFAFSSVTAKNDDESNGIKVTWEHPVVQTNTAGEKFKIYRRTQGTEWSETPIAEVAVSGTEQTHSYVDTEPSNPAVIYEYKVVLKVLGKEVSQVSNKCSISKGTDILTLTASKGTFADMVTLDWEVQQVGSAATKFIVWRSLLGENDYQKLNEVSGTSASYSYNDTRALPGQYYEYMVEAKLDEVLLDTENEDGFCQSTGTLSGRITYGTGTAVEGVKVVLTKSADDLALKAQFHSLYVETYGGGLEYVLSEVKNNAIFGADKPFSIQMWVKPDDAIKAYGTSNNSTPALISTNDFVLYGKYNATKKEYTLGVKTLVDGVWTEHLSNLSIPTSEFTHLTLTYSAEEGLSLHKMTTTAEVKTWNGGNIFTPSVLTGEEARVLSIGKVYAIDQTFTGFIDEVRVWSKSLTDAEIIQNYDHTLSGSELGLAIYSHIDEGIKNQPTAYDYSKTGGVANGLHGKIYGGAKPSTIVPTSDQLSIYGLTDAEGNYVIRGVPFSGEGTNYVVTPMMGIHEFSPKYVTRYVSANSLNHSAIDIEDVSSFPVSGIVYYSGTLYPVEGAYLYVDGSMASRDGQPVMTDDEGKFSLSVPIGDHFIQIKKDGHTFENAGRYPADPQDVGTRFTFDREVSNLSFFDNTLVTVAGRVVGGNVETDKPIGMGLSSNNIGKATIKLSTGYEMNVVLQQNGLTSNYVENSANVEVESPTEDVNSTSYRKGGNIEDVKYIYIQTDPETGEFAALLPPVAYTVEDIKVDNNSAIVFDNLPVIDATNPLVTYTDSASTYDPENSKTFTYHASLIKSYFATPTFTVTDQSNTIGAFGEHVAKVADLNGNETEVELYTGLALGTPTYTFGYPVFIQNNQYRFLLKGYENYVNYDGEEPVHSQVPLSGTEVTITNELSADNVVTIEGAIYGELADNACLLDSLGEAVYVFRAGFPNILEDQDYTRGLNIKYNHNGQALGWDGNSTFKAVIFGVLPTGTNFVTAGPDEVHMVLRDPPGSNSSAYWEQGTTATFSRKVGGKFSSDAEFATVTRFGTELKTSTGTPLFATITDFESKADMTVGTHVSSHIVDSKEDVKTVTTTKRISTSDSPDYVGEQGDVFIGSSTNVLFGKARSVCLIENGGSYSIGLKETYTTNSTFGTAFSYTQYYVENVLIPNMESLRNAMLQSVSESDYNNYVNNTGRPVYLTKLSPDDERFATSNFDEEVWGAEALDSTSQNKLVGPSYKMVMPTYVEPDSAYQDSVEWYNTQIAVWIKTLADNEKAKVTAIENRADWLKENASFDAGTIIEGMVDSTDSKAQILESETDVNIIFGWDTGVQINKTGVLLNLRTEVGSGAVTEDIEQTDSTKLLGYTLAESGFNDALTIDIYNAPDGYGPIFVTRGGQTSCPYEAETQTKYYRPGTTLSTATMQVEIPEITVTNAYATDVPAGGKASYELKLANLSETGDDIWFDLALIDESNPDGAKLTMDGAVLTDGRAILLPAGTTLKKTLLIEQTDQSVLDYENIQLVLKSQCQGDPTGIFPAIADTLSLSAYFVPSCSDISLRIEERTMNMFTSDTLTMEIGDFDRNYRSFKGIRIQYKYANDVDWTLAQEFVVNAEDKTNNNEMLPEGSPITYKLDMSNSAIFPDGTYTVRAITMCDFGAGEVNNESEEIEVVKDMERPLVLGSANPSDGILNAGDDIFVTFNEDIRNGAITSGANFIVTGVLNGAKVDHSTSLQLNGTAEAAAKTDATFSLGKQSFATDMWVNISSEGTIFSHGAGNNKFTLGVNASGNLVVGIAGNKYTSAKAIPMDKWVFVSFNYEYNAGDSKINAQVASDAETIRLFDNHAVADYTGNGPVAVGENLTGSIHELTLWNRARTLAESQAEMYVTKAASTPNLIGYWKMDEGKGTTLADKARSRHMTSTGNWELNNENYAAAFNGKDSYINLDISAVSARPTDDYAVELWFNANAQKNVTIFSVGNDRLSLRINAEGKLALKVGDKETQLSANDWLDGQWHHFALNVLRNGVTIAYIDGNNVCQMVSADMPALQGDALVLGAQRTYANSAYTYSEYFKGAIDEVRYWNATMTGKLIADRNNQRMDTTVVAGLSAYYPFEARALDAYGQVVTTFSTDDQSVNNKTAINTKAVNVTKAATAPGLKEAPAETNLQFTYTASERQVFVTLLDAPARLEGTTVNFTLRNVRDMNNNIMPPVMWSAYISQNRLKWSEESIELERNAGDEKTEFSVTISNNGADTEQWSIVNLPSWLTVSDEQGSLRPLTSKTLRFTVSPSVAIGNYEETLMLSGNDGIYEPMIVSLKVKAEAPDWNVNPADFEQSMNIIGQLQIDGVVSDDSDDLLAAFIDGQCVGVASANYYSRYDTHYVIINIYGNNSSTGKEVTFRMWDASTGDIYPSVAVSEAVKFSSNNVIGDMKSPFIWNAKEAREQQLSLNAGWTWMSLSVNPEDKALNAIFPDADNTISTVKSSGGFAMPSNGAWMGTLTEMSVGNLYMVNSTAPVDLSIYGKSINPADEPVTIAPMWNWIGYNTPAVASLNDAFADLEPENGDIVKGQKSFAIYQDYEWVGTLNSLEPGVGYMYRSKATANKTFHYPAKATVTELLSRSRNMTRSTDPEYYTQVAPGLYPNSMTVVAVVMRGGEILTDVEVGVFAGDECREAIRSFENGKLFLTIHGEGSGTTLKFRVYVDGKDIEAAQTLEYVDNAMVGSPDDCYVIDLDNAVVGIENITSPLDNVKVYTVTGVYLGDTTRGLESGIYIIDGKKVFVK